MAEQKPIVDFLNGGDTGEDKLEAIQPVTNGEGANQNTFRRPAENLRSRTEILRGEVEELKHYRDFGNGSLFLEYESNGGALTWNGPGPGASPAGEITNTNSGVFRISPLLCPSGQIYGDVEIGVGGVNLIRYENYDLFSTEGGNNIYVSHVSVAGASLSVFISEGPNYRIVVTFDDANAAHTPNAAKVVVDAAILAHTTLTGKITTSTNGAGIIDSVTDARIEGTVEDLNHEIQADDIATLTATTPLEEGMGIAIWYRYLIEPVAGDPGDPKGVSGWRPRRIVGRSQYSSNTRRLSFYHG